MTPVNRVARWNNLYTQEEEITVFLDDRLAELRRYREWLTKNNGTDWAAKEVYTERFLGLIELYHMRRETCRQALRVISGLISDEKAIIRHIRKKRRKEILTYIILNHALPRRDTILDENEKRHEECLRDLTLMYQNMYFALVHGRWEEGGHIRS